MFSKLTRRDLLLFELIDDFGMLSTRQLKELLFKEIAKRTMLRRLQKLEKLTYLQRISGLPRAENSWALTAKAAKLVGSELVINNVNKNTLLHDIIVNDIRLALRNIGKNWISGHLLKQAGNKSKNSFQDEFVIPDSLFSLPSSSSSRTIALELELFAKSKKRYRRILDLYHYYSEVDYLWYVVPHAKVGEKALSQINDNSSLKPYECGMWSLIDELCANPMEARLHFKNICVPFSEFYQMGFKKGSANFEVDTNQEKKAARSRAHWVSSEGDLSKLWLRNKLLK